MLYFLLQLLDNQSQFPILLYLPLQLPANFVKLCLFVLLYSAYRIFMSLGLLFSAFRQRLLEMSFEVVLFDQGRDFLRFVEFE